MGKTSADAQTAVAKGTKLTFPECLAVLHWNESKVVILNPRSSFAFRNTRME